MDSTHNPHSLDDFFHKYAQNAVKKPHTGITYNISLLSNFSRIEVWFVRLRSSSFWAQGRNSTLFQIPPRIIPLPFVKRLNIAYENLGNWSTFYYNVPNYTFVTHIIGFSVYDADTNKSSANRSQMLNLSLRGDPILVRFSNVSLKDGDNVTMKCVRFDANGTVEFTNLTMPNLCKAHGQGCFGIIGPYVQPLMKRRGKNEEIWKWWLIGIVVGFGGLILIVFCVILLCKVVRVRKIESMEKMSEKSEALDTVWVGKSKMPSASGIRTQPVLEDDCIP